MASATKPTATIPKIAVARVLTPTTKVRTAAEIFWAIGLVEVRGFLANV
jgi:hypothetical protein